MNAEQRQAVADLRHQGYAVIIWTPEELKGANPRRVEDRSVELGWDVIECLKEDPAPTFRVSEPITYEQFAILCWCLWRMDTGWVLPYRRFLSVLTANWIYDREHGDFGRAEILNMMLNGYEGIDDDWAGYLPARLLNRMESEEFAPDYVNDFIAYALENFISPAPNLEN